MNHSGKSVRFGWFWHFFGLKFWRRGMKRWTIIICHVILLSFGQWCCGCLTNQGRSLSFYLFSLYRAAVSCCSCFVSGSLSLSPQLTPKIIPVSIWSQLSAENTFRYFAPSVKALMGLYFFKKAGKNGMCWPCPAVTHPCSWSILSAGPRGPAAGSRYRRRDEACWTPRPPFVRWGPACSRLTENPETTQCQRGQGQVLSRPYGHFVLRQM